MMSSEDYQHFVCIVAGDNPKDLMAEYDSNMVVKPYVKYYYKDVDKIKKSFIEVYENQLQYIKNDFEKEYITNSILDLKEMSNDEFFEELCDENSFFDEKTGDIKSNKNPKGYYSFCNIGKMFSIPFLTKDGREVFQARKKDIDWDKIHLSGQDVYRRVWEMVMENSEPNNEHEKLLYENMKFKINYFNKFETKENYVNSNTAFWGYAFVSETIGWADAEETKDQFSWISNFYDVFIKVLPEDTLLTIYECKK